MKKIYSYISMLALAAISAGCAEELVSPEELTPSTSEQIINGEVTVDLSVPASAQTKTVLGTKNGDTYPVYWSQDDVITLNGVAATEFTPSDDSKTATATFKVANLASPFNFLYGGVSGTSNQVSFPSTQHYVEGGFDPAAMPMYASVKNVNGNVTFSHVASLLKFSFTGTNQISSINLSAGDAALAGNFTIGATDGVLDGTLTSGVGNSNLVYTFGTDKQLSQTPFVFYVAVPAGTYANGITLEVIDNDSGHMTVKVMNTEESNTIDAGKVREFENVTYAPTKELNLIQINSEATLQTFADRVAAGETTLNARVIADFAVSSSWTSVEGYNGIFDGNSRTITGLDQPLFGVLGGVVKNLTLDSNITATESHNWGIFAKQVTPSIELDDVAGLQNCTAKGSLTYTPEALTKDCQLGGLVGNNKGGAVSNCINEATVTMGDSGVTHGYEVSIGGVVGRTQKGGDLNAQGDISNCTNNGTVVCEAKLGDKNLYIGGVLGFQVESKEYISECVNNGIVKVNASFSTGKALHLGGVIGLGVGKIESCTNGPDGTVISEDGSAAGSYICQGGVVGRLSSSSRTYSGLTNAGNITAYAAGAKSGSYIGGIVGRCDEGASITSCVNTGGTINYSATTTNSDLCIGGIVGKMGKNIQSCTNATAISFTGIAEKPVYLGGIAGHAKGSIIETENNGAISLSEESTVSEGDFIFGGIVGRVDNAEVVSNCVNKADITNACALISDDKYLDLGGIAGWNNNTPIVNCTNSGNINNTADSDGYLFIGGIVGETNADVSGCENSGEISNSGVCAKALENCVGGIAGVNNGNEYASCVNKGKLTSSSDDTNIRVGGIAGYVIPDVEAMFTECVNEGEISISNGADDKVNHHHITVGGVVGRSASKVTLDECDNHGTVNVEITSSNTTGAVIAGGILGDNTDKNVICTGCENHGRVTINNEQTPKVLSDYLVGGIVGYIKEAENGTLIKGCKNNSKLYIKANRGVMGGIVANFYDGEMKQCTSTSESVVEYQCSNSYKMHVAVGGIVGNAWNAQKITECFNAGEVVAYTLTEDKTMGSYVGGVVGWLEDPCVLSDCNNTGFVVCCTGEENAKVAAIAGGIIGYKSSNTTDSGNKNWGEVRAIGQYVSSNVKYPAAAGGIVGLLECGTIDGCYSYGYIKAGQAKGLKASCDKYSGTARSGAIAGFNYKGVSPFPDCSGVITGCYIGGQLKNSSNKDGVTITEENYAGYAVGQGEDPTDCYYAQPVSAPQPE